MGQVHAAAEIGPVQSHVVLRQLEDAGGGANDPESEKALLELAERHDLPVYHADVRVFDVLDADGTQLGLFYADYYARPSKRGGAWLAEGQPDGGRGRRRAGL